MDAFDVIAHVQATIKALGLLATLPIWTVDGPGETREARLAPAIGPALPPAPYGYDDYDPAFFDAFEGADAPQPKPEAPPLRNPRRRP